jgi:hypothetical protein
MLDQTLPLMSIAKRWAEALAADPNITDFCQAKYGKQQIIYLGMDTKHLPNSDNCPRIIIQIGEKLEGEGERQHQYILTVGWTIKNEKFAQADNIIEYAGMQECDDLGQLIYSCINSVNPDFPIETATYTIAPIDFFPQFVGDLEAVITINNVIGVGQIEY